MNEITELFGIPVVVSDDIPPATAKLVNSSKAFDQKVAEIAAAIRTVNLLYGDGTVIVKGYSHGAITVTIYSHQDQMADIIRELSKACVVHVEERDNK